MKIFMAIFSTFSNPLEKKVFFLSVFVCVCVCALHNASSDITHRKIIIIIQIRLCKCFESNSGIVFHEIQFDRNSERNL